MGQLTRTRVSKGSATCTSEVFRFYSVIEALYLRMRWFARCFYPTHCTSLRRALYLPLSIHRQWDRREAVSFVFKNLRPNRHPKDFFFRRPEIASPALVPSTKKLYEPCHLVMDSAHFLKSLFAMLLLICKIMCLARVHRIFGALEDKFCSSKALSFKKPEEGNSRGVRFAVSVSIHETNIPSREFIL